ncbi:MAG: MBL fold metallo-hydrolase [Patescibacteria group bacterium]
MVVSFFGEGSFRVQNGELSVLVDPTNNRLKADVVLRTITPADVSPMNEEYSGQNISFPGEYEIKGIEITGVPILGESGENFLKTAYLVRWEDVSLAFLGHLSKPLLPEVADGLGEPDVLFIPVGGGHFLSAEAATKVVKQFEPSVVIPSFFKNIGEFGKAMGQKVISQDKFVFRAKDLMEGGMRIVALESKN